MFEGDDIIAAMQEWQRVICHAQAQQLKAFARLLEQREQDGFEAGEHVPDEIALALTMSRVAAGARLGQAVVLTERLPATLAALQRGDIDLTRAQAISDAVTSLSAEHATAVEAMVLAKATQQNAPQLRRALKRAVLVVDPDGGRQRHEHRARERRLVVSPDIDGMSHLYAYLPAPAATAIYLTVNTAARAAKTPQDNRTADQRRADAFVDLLIGTATAPRAQVKVVVPAGTLLGLDNQPAELAGYGPITADLARHLAADATWTRLLTDPASGTLLDHGRTTYKPPAALADFVRARDKPAGSPAAPAPPNTANSTTAPHTRTARPAPTTSTRCVLTITSSNTAAPGRAHAYPTATTTGPPRPAASTSATPNP